MGIGREWLSVCRKMALSAFSSAMLTVVIILLVLVVVGDCMLRRSERE